MPEYRRARLTRPGKSGYIPVLIEAIKEQQKEIEFLKKKLSELR